MGIDSHLSTCVGTQSPKYLEMAQGHISLSYSRLLMNGRKNSFQILGDGCNNDFLRSGLSTKYMLVTKAGLIDVLCDYIMEI
jgi:hypothetical protein